MSKRADVWSKSENEIGMANSVKLPVAPVSTEPVRESGTRRFADSTPPTMGRLAKVVHRSEKAPGINVQEVEVLRTPERVREALRMLFAYRCAGHVRARSGDRSIAAPIQAARLQPGQPLPLHWQLDEEVPEPPFTIEVEGYLSVFRFEVYEATRSGGFLAVRIPEEITRTRSRNDRRVIVRQGMTVSFSHPDRPDLRIRRAVRTVSANGVGFSTTTPQDQLSVGMLLKGVVVEAEDRLRVEFDAVVTGSYGDLDGHGETTGMRVEPVSVDDAAHWDELVYSLVTPNTRQGGTWSGQLWDLFDKSAYFQLSGKSEHDFRPLRGAFEAASRKLGSAPELGCQVVWPSNRGIEATASMLKIYDHTTFLYHVARQHGRAPLWTPANPIMRDIHAHAIMQAQRDRSLRWLLVWVQEDSRFSRVAYHDLPLRYVTERRGLVYPFRAIECSTEGLLISRSGSPPADGLVSGPSSAPPASGESAAQAKADRPVEVRAATGKEIDSLLTELPRIRPPDYCDAHDLVPERAGLQETAAKWNRAGLTRARHVLYARRADTEAFAILELSDDGLHLFGLLDVMRAFAFSEAGKQLFPDLLQAARKWYAFHGKRKFIYVLEDGNVEDTQSAEFTDLGGAYMTLLRAELLPELLEHLHEIVGTRNVPPLPYGP